MNKKTNKPAKKPAYKRAPYKKAWREKKEENTTTTETTINMDKTEQSGQRFSFEDVDKIFNANKTRAEIKEKTKQEQTGSTETAEITQETKATEIKYEKFEETEPSQQQNQDQKWQKEFQQKYDWIDGTFLLFILDGAGMMLVPMFAKLLKHEAPEPDQIALNDKQREALKAPADAVVERLKKYISAEGAIALIVLVHWFGVIKSQPKL